VYIQLQFANLLRNFHRNLKEILIPKSGCTASKTIFFNVVLDESLASIECVCVCADHCGTSLSKTCIKQLSHTKHCIFPRIVRAFLIEEQKIVVRVLKAQSGNKGKGQ
jgi:hypothetical protein